VVFDEYHARIVAAACLLVMSQSAQRCPSTSLLRSADYAGFLFGARARQSTTTELIIRQATK
jgi:hypothetical protein